MPQPLLIEHDDGVDRVTLNRPDSLNALDPALIDALNVYFQGLQRNRDTRVVVLKGAGHFVWDDQPERASRALVDFLARRA